MREVAHFCKHFCTGTPLGGGDPANKVGSRAKEGVDFAVSRRAWLKATVYAPAACAVGKERRRRRSDPVCVLTVLLGEFLACGPSVTAAHQSLGRQIRLERWRLSDVYSPKRPTNGEKVFGIVNLFMAEEFSSGPVGSIAEIVGQLAGSVPSPGGLRVILVHKGKARVSTAECDHVKGEDTRERASSRTRRAPSSSGNQWPASSRAGGLPSRRLRGRSNQRRTPMSL